MTQAQLKLYQHQGYVHKIAFNIDRFMLFPSRNCLRNSKAAQVQKKIGARNYVECSALTAYNLKKVRRPESPIRRNYFVDFFENIRKTN